MSEKTEETAKDIAANPEHLHADFLPEKPIPTSWGYRGFVLVSCAFVIFELIFVSLYSSTSWFETDIRYLGIPVVFLLLPVAHQILLSFNRKLLVLLASPVRNGLPLVIYWSWLTMGDKALSIGLRKVAYSTIDELKLTIWGNLHIRTRALRLGATGFPEGHVNGEAADKSNLRAKEPTDLIFKLPLGVVSPQFQKNFIETVEAANPNVVINKRLRKKLSQQDVSASQMIGVMGAVIMLIVLIDLGQSSYTYLDVLKNYYHADLSARRNEKADSERYFDQGEKLLKESLPMSWIKNKFFDEGNGAASVKIARAEALWHMGRRQEAVDECRNALKLSPKAFRINLRLARMLNLMDSPKEAKAEIEEAMKIKKDSFLPRGYMVALEFERTGTGEAQKLYETYLKELDDELFAEEPVWPPGGERFLHDIWYREDLTFVFNRLLKLVHRS